MIGLLPAAGKAERLYGLPKFLLPCPGGYLLKRHMDMMKSAGCKRVLVGANEDTCDFIRPTTLDFYLAGHYDTMSETILSYLEYTSDIMAFSSILFGMPDTYFTDDKLYADMAGFLNQGDCDIVAGVFLARTWQRSQLGMVDIDEQLYIQKVIDKPEDTDLLYSWATLAWKYDFWQYIRPDDAHVGFALQRAIEHGLKAKAVIAVGKCYDCGTWQGYAEMVRDTSEA